MIRNLRIHSRQYSTTSGVVSENAPRRLLRRCKMPVSLLPVERRSGTFIRFTSILPTGWAGKRAGAGVERADSHFRQLRRPAASHPRYIRKRGAEKANWRSGAASCCNLVEPAVMFWTRQRVSHYHHQAPPPASSLSDVSGRGLTRLQRSMWGGCCEAIRRTMQQGRRFAGSSELGGPSASTPRGVSWAVAATQGWTLRPGD